MIVLNHIVSFAELCERWRTQIDRDAGLGRKNAPIRLMLSAAMLVFGTAASGEEYAIPRFERTELTDVYYSEGANIGDLNRDGHVDIVYGPHWYAGPEFKVGHEIYPAKPQPRERYADNFFSWVYDFNGDGWSDVLVVGFPGTPAHVYENPRDPNGNKLWPKHEVLDWVSNESPQFTNLIGDEYPELVCTRDGYFGYARIDPAAPIKSWTFHAVSDQVATKRFGHGLGVGDVNGDGRPDILTKGGWFEQPEVADGSDRWPFHAYQFTKAGGADMFAYDVDGDGDNDVITSLQAHEFGLAWFEQIERDGGGGITFEKHLIMGKTPNENRYGIVFSELHTVNLADMDGDGLKDIVTGKTYWSHHTKSPMWDAGAVVYWFKLQRNGDDINWIPMQADGDSGVGRQVIVGDVNGDDLPDIVAGGMKGANVLTQSRKLVDRDQYLNSLPRPRQALQAGLEPPEAARNMTVPAGFRVQLAAGEPDVHQPVAMCFDHRGRLWVAEAYTYPIRAPEGQGRDKIIILEDTDQDGSLDSRKVFADGLNLVSGLQVGFGGVWVGAAPYLLFIPDADGDDQPDGEPRVLLDGWGYQDTHETLNSFTWGPDGWLYGCHGVFTHSRVGKPGTPDADRIPFNCGVWRYHPGRHEFEAFARGTSNPWGIDFDQHGQAFITACVIPHLWHMIQGGRYHRQGGQHFNPHLYDDIKTIADHAHYTGSIRDHAWWRGKEPELPHATSDAGGGHAHCGAMIYHGDNFPDRYRGGLFMNNIHGNRVNCDVMERAGSGFVGRHAPDFLLANDKWFRGIDLKYGPDGSVHLIDWYDRNACHRRDPEIWDRTNGRVYRVVWGDRKPVQVDLSTATDDELVGMHTHANEWYVRMARRLLQERGGSDVALAGLRRLIESNRDVPIRLRALWTLHAIGGLNEERRITLMSDTNEYVRAWAVQLELEDRQASSAALARMEELAATDESAVVRLYLASALQRLPLDRRWGLASRLIGHGQDSDDHNLPLMYWYAIEPLVPHNTERALQLAGATSISLLKQYITRRAAAPDASLDQVIAMLANMDDSRDQLMTLGEILSAFEGRVNISMPSAWQKAYEKLSRAGDASVRDRADKVAVSLGDRRIFPRMRELLGDQSAETGQRRRALDILIQGSDSDAVPLFLDVLKNADLRGPAIRALAGFDEATIPNAMLERYQEFNESEKRDAINTLVSRPAFGMKLLDAVDRNAIPRSDVHAFNVRQLLRFEDTQLEERIRATWGSFRQTSAEKRQQITRLRKQLTPRILAAGNTSNGRVLFNKTCAACHRLFGTGGNIGPDITGSNRRNLDYILENIVDPSAVLGRDYRLTVIATADGRVVSGIVRRETDSAVTLQTINDLVVVARDDIEERRLSELSMMPEKLLDPLKPQEVRDLIAYLASPNQVPLRGAKSTVDQATGKVAGAIEGESLKAKPGTPGRVRAQGMTNFRGDQWSGSSQLWWTGARPGDRLELDVSVEKSGRYGIEVVLTRARDYGIVQLFLDSTRLGGPVDLFNSPDVLTTGVLNLGTHQLSGGRHKLVIAMEGANPRAVKSYMAGLDYIRFTPAQAGD